MLENRQEGLNVWIRWIEEVGGDVRDSDGLVGGPRDLEDVRKKRKSRHSVIFFEFAVGFAKFFLPLALAKES